MAPHPTGTSELALRGGLANITGQSETPRPPPPPRPSVLGRLRILTRLSQSGVVVFGELAFCSSSSFSSGGNNLHCTSSSPHQASVSPGFHHDDQIPELRQIREEVFSVANGFSVRPFWHCHSGPQRGEHSAGRRCSLTAGREQRRNRKGPGLNNALPRRAPVTHPPARARHLQFYHPPNGPFILESISRLNQSLLKYSKVSQRRVS